MSGLHSDVDEVKCYWLIECMAPKFRKVVENLVESSECQLVPVLSKMNTLFPQLENDLSIRLLLDKIPLLPYQPEPSVVAQMFFDIEERLAELTDNAMSDQEKLILLIKKVHPRTYQEMRQDRFYKDKMSTFFLLKESLLSKTMEDWTEKSLSVHKKQLMNPLDTQGKPGGAPKQPFLKSNVPTPPLARQVEPKVVEKGKERAEMQKIRRVCLPSSQ